MRPNFSLAILCVVLLVLGVAQSQPTETARIFPRELPKNGDGKLRCQTERAPDYYGLGVRLGTYFTWFQAYIANTLLPGEIASALDTNTIFLLTLLIAMIKCSSVEMLMQVDGLILMHLSGGTIFGIFSIWGYRTVHYTVEGPRAIKHYGGFGTHARLFLCLAVYIFGLWFWMFAVTGALENMGPDDGQGNSEDCSTLYTFMFAKVRASGRIRIFYIFICIACIVYFGIMLLVSSVAGYARARKMVILAKNKQWANSTRLRFSTGFTYHELRFIYKVLKWGNLAFLIYSVLLVEFSLNFNHVTAVLGGPNDNEIHLPAQLLPLLIGAFGFVRICYLVLEDWRNPAERDPSSATFSDDDTTPRHSQRLRFGADVLQLFSPAMEKDEPTRPMHRDGEMDGRVEHDSLAVRYLISWLPWLSLLRSANRAAEEPGKPGNQSRHAKVVDGERQDESAERTREAAGAGKQGQDLTNRKTD